MPIEEQREFKSAPYNVARGFAEGKLELKQDYCAADLGTITVVGEGCFLRIDGTEILSLDMGPKNLEVSIKLFSDTNELLVDIQRNEWMSGDPMPWDIEAGWQRLVLREKARKISIDLDGRQKPLKITGEFWFSGRKITIAKENLLVHGAVTHGFSNFAFVGGGVDIDKNEIRIANGGAIISWHNTRERLWKARNRWKQIKAARESGKPLDLTPSP